MNSNYQVYSFSFIFDFKKPRLKKLLPNNFSFWIIFVDLFIFFLCRFIGMSKFIVLIFYVLGLGC